MNETPEAQMASVDLVGQIEFAEAPGFFGIRYYARRIDPVGHITPMFDSDIIGYFGEDGLQDLLDHCKRAHAEHPFMSHQILAMPGLVPVHHWKRRVHPLEAAVSVDDDFDLFYDWLCDVAQLGGEPQEYNAENYAEHKRRVREGNDWDEHTDRVPVPF